jgi:MFS family permease
MTHITSLYKPSNTSISNIIQLSALLLITMMGAAVTSLMPLIVGAYSDSGKFTAQQVGWLTAADIAGILVASVSAFFWCRRVNWQRYVLAGLVIFMGANFLSTTVSDFFGLTIIRFVAGCGCGVMYAIALAALSDLKKPEVAFGAVVSIQVMFGTVGFFLLPGFIADNDISVIFHFFNLCLLPTLILCLLSFPLNTKHQQIGTLKIKGSTKAAAFIFTGVVVYYFAQGVVWGYLERIGVDAQIIYTDIGIILGVGFALSVIGSIVSGYYVEKLSRRSGLLVTAIIQLPCLFALYQMEPANAYWVYAISTVLYQLMWSFVVPIMMAIFSDVDRSGKLVVVCVSAFKMGLVIGPPLAS